MWSADTIVRAVKGTAYRVERESFSAISTDSRTIGPGEFFIPLKGPRFDGHLFINAAYERTGAGSLCDRTRGEICGHARGTIILVDDTNQALLDLAAFKRAETEGTFVAITGSNGKTTTKELLVHLLTGLFPIVSNEKNYNNCVGVAKTMLAIEGSPRCSIFELGTNHEGEIATLTSMVRPHLSLITNINPSHLEGLRDLEGVQREKLSLFEGTLAGGTIFINADDPSLAPFRRDGCHRRTFGIRKKADFRLQVTADRGLEGFEIALIRGSEKICTVTHLLGHHNLYNVLAAAVLALALGTSPERLRELIPTFEPYKGRFRPVRSRRGYTVVDDAYNANPASMAWAIRTLSALPCRGKRVAILGDMRELGARTGEYHRELGHLMGKSEALSMILLLGSEMKATAKEIGNDRAHLFEEKKKLIDFVTDKLTKEDIVLVKGSRGLGMDEIVEALV